VEDQLFVPEHEGEAPGHDAEGREEAFGDDLPPGEEFPEEQDGDEDGEEFQGKKVAQGIFGEAPEFLKDPAPAFGFVGVGLVHFSIVSY
jgi:hypothetical protein